MRGVENLHVMVCSTRSMRRCSVWTSGGESRTEHHSIDLPRDDGGVADTRAGMVDVVAVLEAASWKLDGAIELCEQKIVAAALMLSSGNRSRAARMLGISPRSMFNKMRKYQLTA